MKLLQTVIFVLVGLSAGTAVWAEANEPEVQSLKEQLNLTEPQTRELNKLYKETRTKNQALRKEIRDLARKKHEGMLSVLTPEQKKKYEELNAEPTPPPGMEPPPMMSTEPDQPAQ